jgi:hypothetical protein
MRKFSLILESNESVYDKIGLDKEEIVDICQDLIDDEWEVNIEEAYLSKTGKIYKTSGSSSEYYPMIEIDIWKTPSKKEESDVRHWDGGIYFSNEFNNLKSLYLTIDRLKNITSRLNDVNIYWAFRKSNEIMIRITLDTEKTDNPVPYEKLNKIINDLRTNKREFENNNPMRNYKVSDGWSGSGGKYEFEITPDVTSSQEKFDKIIKTGVRNSKHHYLSDESSNIFDFPDIINHLLTYIKDKTGTDEIELDLCGFDSFIDTSDQIFEIKCKDEVILTISARTSRIGSSKYIVKKGLIRDTYEEFVFYKLIIKIEY